jgi:hypothetical protein
VLLACTASGVAAEEYDFDASEFEKKAFEIGGYAELKQEAIDLRPDSVQARLRFADPREHLDRTTATLELTGAWHWESAVVNVRTESEWVHDQTETESENSIQEGGLRLSFERGLSLDAGKRVQRWGKGYAWNPVGFVERPKDPNDPQQNREGYVMAGAEWVKSLHGPLTAVALTPLVVPVRDDINSDFGAPGHTNPAARLYLLWHDTDIDFLWLGKGSRAERFGLDFSRNLGANLEVHGEWARILDQPRRVADAQGNVTQSVADADSWLLGLRYLTERDVTWIAEYYRNGAGYSADELADFYSFADAALDAGGTVEAEAVSLSQAGYGQPNPGRDYFYLRMSAKEPFDILYFTPALIAIVNVDDHSYSLTPEVTYTGVTNLELRARSVFTHGGRYTDYGEKASRLRVEVYARWFF